MCLQVPGKVIKVEKDTAIVDYDIEKRKVIIADIVPKKGDWVIVVGKFIVEIVPEDSGRESLNHWKKIMNY
jgi:hydrogenase assembly chaperone HypC/HupF